MKCGEYSSIDLLSTSTCHILSESDQKSILVLKNLIANIESGHVSVLDRSGLQTSEDTAELTLILHGKPAINLY